MEFLDCRCSSSTFSKELQTFSGYMFSKCAAFLFLENVISLDLGQTEAILKMSP